MGTVVREQYGPNLVAYAAWGGCNARSAVVPLGIDILPGEADNLIQRRGIQVALLSSPLLDVAEELDMASVGFGATGAENSRYRCTKRARDVNGDGLPDLVCVFLYERTMLARSAEHANMLASTKAGVPLQGRDGIRFSSPQ